MAEPEDADVKPVRGLEIVSGESAASLIASFGSLDRPTEPLHLAMDGAVGVT